MTVTTQMFFWDSSRRRTHWFSYFMLAYHTLLLCTYRAACTVSSIATVHYMRPFILQWALSLWKRFLLAAWQLAVRIERRPELPATMYISLSGGDATASHGRGPRMHSETHPGLSRCSGKQVTIRKAERTELSSNVKKVTGILLRDSKFLYLMKTFLNFSITSKKKYKNNFDATRILKIVKDTISSDFLIVMGAQFYKHCIRVANILLKYAGFLVSV